MLTNPIPERYKSDHLFLLVGENPLPLYVSAMLLSNENATVYLLHSDGAEGTPSTKPYADFLIRVLSKHRPDFRFVYYGLNEGDSVRIKAKMAAILSDEKLTDKHKVGLNYTGGTKAMALHSHSVLSRQLPKAVFSYLDANRLVMRIDDETTAFPVARALDVSLQDLAQLHGYALGEIEKQPKSAVLARAIAEIAQTEEGLVQWQEWRSQLFGDSPKLPIPTEPTASELMPFIEACETVCSGADGTTLDNVANALGFNALRSAAKWFKSEWLEDLVLDAIIANRQRFDIQNYGKNIEPQPDVSHGGASAENFELDVAAMLGYQLYALSCIVTTPARDGSGGFKLRGERAKVKEHLFEVHERGRQMGGDEARVAVVSTLKTPESLQAEVEHAWLATGKVKVFGRYDLLDLPTAFRTWFEQTSF